MDPVLIVVAILLLVEIPWSLRATVRIVRRYRVRLKDSRIFRFLAQTVVRIAAVVVMILLLVLYAIGRGVFPQVVPQMPAGVFTAALGIILGTLAAIPIAIDRELSRIERTDDPSVTANG